MNEAKSKCRYCRIVGNHHVDCPKDDSTAILFWSTGHRAATAGLPNPHPDEPLVTMGYEAGKLEIERLSANEQRPSTPPEALFPEDAPEPRPRHSFPSVTELSLALQERNDPPPIPEDRQSEFSDEHGVPPVLRSDPKAVFDREIAAREADLY